MKKAVVLLVVLGMIGFSSNAMAFSWEMYDFGDSPFDHNNNWAPYSYPYDIGQLPSPGEIGEGGEKFDIEGFHFAMDGSTAHLALTNSFGYGAYSTGWNQIYYQGDIFFGFDGNSYQYAIDISEGLLYEVDTYTGISDKPGTYYFDTDIRNAAGGWEITSGTVLGEVDNVRTLWRDFETDYLLPGDGDTYVWEFAFDAGLVSGFSGAQSVSFHTTLECGNDWVDATYEVVPEPTTILLMGLGLLGAGVVRKKFRI